MEWYDIAAVAVNVVLLMLVSRRLIHIFQLEGYHYRGYIKWCTKDSIDKYLFTYLVAAAAGQLTLFLLMLFKESIPNDLYTVLHTYRVLPLIFYAAVLIYDCINYNKTAFKKPLAYTKRIWRLYIALFIVCAAVSAVLLLLFDFMFVSVLFVPIWVLLAALLVNPIEKLIQNRFFKKAQSKLASSKAIRIGITGSYGKTSTKFILGTILSEKYKVLVTPASYNTPMGVSKCINENLSEEHDIFIAEMGAAHKGDIAELCRLVHPQYGILTSVGRQHLETFGSIDNIIKTKFDLIRSLPHNGAAFFNGDNKICADLSRREIICETKYVYGISQEDFYMRADDISCGSEGSSFTLMCSDGSSIKCRTALLGQHNIINIVGCAAIAYALGLTMEQIASGIAKAEPVEHRLQLIKGAGGVNVIDDAFNSNPEGAKAALETLGQFPGTRVVITPGMVQLGSSEEEENTKLGHIIAQYADIAILVGKKRTAPIREGLIKAGFDEARIYSASDLNDATTYMSNIIKPGDTVLFENDLPDNYNE